jgi:hypothetical protein
MFRRTPLKRKPRKRATGIEAYHLARVAAMPCLVSGKRPVTVHHCTGYADRMGRLPRSHTRVVPLAAEYHLIQHGPRESVEALGHRGFYERYGIDLLAVAERLWEETVEEWDG